jgi:class 3 adenylate cyclase/tetratricopeptide (TPR) repeat protein
VRTEERKASIDDLLDRAATAVNRGDRQAAATLASRVLAVDEHNAEAEDLLACPSDGGEIRRLTMLFADLVDSTVLSTRVEPETYRLLVGRYREQVLAIVNGYEGHIGSTKGDGLLAVFGHPMAHEDDVQRAVLAGLAIVRAVARLDEQSRRRFGIEIAVRVGVHRGLVYLDTNQDDVYGLGANLASRVSGLAKPGTVVVSAAVERLVRGGFELEECQPAAVKGVEELIAHHLVLGERTERVKGRNRPLVGRDLELRRLEKSWSQARTATLATPGVVYWGEPGIGKSRLAAFAEEMVDRSGGAVVELTGSAFHTGTGLHPVRNLLERRCRISRLTAQPERLQLLEAEVAALGLDHALVALLAPVAGIAPEAGYEQVAVEGAKLFGLIAEAVEAYLRACLGRRPALLVVEDAHWFDPDTLEILEAVLGAADGRLLVVITGRPGGWLPDDWPVEVVKLTALSDEEADALIATLNPALKLDERAAVRARCDGVPFYIEQVVAGLDGPAVPEALYEPLFARLRASANAVPVVQAAGIIGRRVDRGLLGTVCTLSEADVDDVIAELEKALVLEQWGVDGWRFRHELLREVAVELAPPTVRRRLHAKVADALVGAEGNPDWGLVAGHYARAERFDAAALAFQQATTDARRRGALGEARSYLNQALEQLARAEPGTDRDRWETSVRLERGWLVASADGGRSDAAAMDFDRCLELTGTGLHAQDVEGVLTLLEVVESYIMRADPRRVVQLLTAIGASFGETWPFNLMVDTWFGTVAWFNGEFDTAARQLEKAADGFTATDLGHPGLPRLEERFNLTVVSAYTQLVLAHLVRGDLTAAEAALENAERLTHGFKFPEEQFSLAFVRFVEIWLRLEAGEIDRASTVAADVTEMGERHGLKIIRLFGVTWQAGVEALVALGDHRVGSRALSGHIETMTGLVDTLKTVEVNEFVTFFDSVLGRLLIADGQAERARAVLDAALQFADDSEMRFYNAELLRLRSRTHGDDAARAADIAAARDLACRQGARLFELRAAIDDVELRGDVARPALADVVSRFPANECWTELVTAHLILR